MLTAEQLEGAVKLDLPTSANQWQVAVALKALDRLVAA